MSILSKLNRRPYKVFTPRTANKVNDWMVRASRDDGGGWAILKGYHQPEEPYYLQPGIRLWGPAHPTMYSKTYTIRPRYSNAPVFQLEDGVRYGPRKAWGGAELAGFQIDPQTEGLTAINVVGGNGSEVRNISSAMGRYPLEYGIRVVDGRDHDGQYSTFDRVRLTRVRNAVVWGKNAPDCIVSRGMFYGDDTPESKGLHAYGNNLTVSETHFQFYGQGLDLNAKELEVNGGSWENRSGRALFGDYAVRVGPNAEDVTVRSLSLANFSSVDRVFQLDPAARRYTFEYLSGHVNKSHVPAGFESHFVWHQE